MAMPFDYNQPKRQMLARPQQASFNIGRVIDLLRRRVNFNEGVQDTNYFPFSAICRLTLDFPDETNNFQGTGFYIGPGLILTAGHNFISDGGREATRIIVEPGYNAGTVFPSFTVTPSDWDVHPKFLNQDKPGFDFGVIRTTHAPPNNEYFRLINYSPVEGTKLALSGYGFSDTVSGDVQHLDIATFTELAEQGEMLRFDIYALGGHSGSPCFVDFEPNRSGGYSADHLPVMAILQGGRTDLSNRGVLLTPEKIDWINAHDTSSQLRSFTQALGGPNSVGGLPLITRPRSSLGGLPLMPAQPALPVAMPMHPQPAPAAGTPTGAGPKTPAAAAQALRARPMSRSWIVADPDRGMSVEKRTFGKVANDLSGKTTLEVIIRDMPEGGSVRWNIPDAADRAKVMFENGASTSPSANGTRVTLRSLAPGVAHVDCMVKDASGTTIESNKYLVSSPHFIKVVFDPNVDSFLNGLGLSAQRQRVIDEMRAVTSLLYENVNVRFVMPGDALPAHLDGVANVAFPGGTAVSTSVSIINVTAEVDAIDPEQTHRDGATARFSRATQGRNHSPGDLPAPLNNHNISTVLLGHMHTIATAGSVETTLAAGGVGANDLQLAANMYGRLLGEVTGHEFGHNPHGTFTGHNTTPDGLLAEGFNRSFAEMTGMAPGTGGAILDDNGIAGINRLSAANLRAFENAMPVNPPLDSAEERTRGRAGSFAVRSLSGETVHLPGATVLDGWQAEVLIFAIEEAIAVALSAGNPALFFVNQFIVDFDRILDACDAANITVGIGTAIGGGVVAGGTGGAGIVFAPGRRIGFYGALSAVAGAVASGGVSAQFTVVRGGPENFGGASFTAGVNVATIGWFDAGLFDIPVGAHVIFNTSGDPIGFTAEIGVSIGVPGYSLIEGFGQAVWTETTIDNSRRMGRALSVTDPSGDLRSRAIAAAVAKGATPDQAAEFADRLFT